MTDFVVDAPRGLESFLRRQGVQRWRIPILLAHGGVVVLRRGAALTAPARDTRLDEGDVVRVLEPPPAAAAAALAHAARHDAHDLAFVPGTTEFEETMRGLMRHRPRTALFDHALVDHLRGFVAALGRSDSVTHPIRDLIIGSHANREGRFFIKPDLLEPDDITYEVLEEAVRNRRFTVAGEHLEPRPFGDDGAPLAPRILIRGCRIGNAPAYLRKLKEAFGHRYAVVAPKHFHVVARHLRPAGFVEYLAYGFTLSRPRPFRTRALAVAAFAGAGFTRIDGAPVPSGRWGEWLPASITRNARSRVAVRSPVTGGEFSPIAEFQVSDRPFLVHDGSFDLERDPGTETERKRALKEAMLARHERYRDTHPFPMYVRYGHASLDEFLDSWTWRFRYDRRRRVMHFNGNRIEYTVIRPVVDPATNELYLNFYPSGPEGSVIERLRHEDARFFEMV